MILAQVREDERVEAHAVEAPEGRAVRAGLDGRAHVARVEHLAKQPLEIDRLGRRERRGTRLASDLPFDGPDEAWLATRRIENRAQEERRGRLPVRSRDTCDLELLRRLAEEEVGGDCHRLAHGRHDELRDIDLERPLDDDGGSTALDRLPGEVVAVDSLAAGRRRRARRQSRAGCRTRGRRFLQAALPSPRSAREPQSTRRASLCRKASCGGVRE